MHCINNDKQQIPIFVINLKKDTEKKQHMQELCQKCKLQAEFIEAVDGRALNTNEVEKVYSSKKAIDKIGRELSRGEIGCALSHKMIYQKMVDENISEAIVLEDDIDFDKELLEILQGVDNFPNRWNIVLLGHHTCENRNLETHCSIWKKTKLTRKYTLARPVEVGCGTYGYMLKLEAAKILLGDLKIIYKPIDHYTGIDEKLNLYIISPVAVKIHDYLSSNHHGMIDRKKLRDNIDKKIQKISYKRKILEFLHLYKITLKLLIILREFNAATKSPRKYQ